MHGAAHTENSERAVFLKFSSRLQLRPSSFESWNLLRFFRKTVQCKPHFKIIDIPCVLQAYLSRVGDLYRCKFGTPKHSTYLHIT